LLDVTDCDTDNLVVLERYRSRRGGGGGGGHGKTRQKRRVWINRLLEAAVGGMRLGYITTPKEVAVYRLEGGGELAGGWVAAKQRVAVTLSVCAELSSVVGESRHAAGPGGRAGEVVRRARRIRHLFGCNLTVESRDLDQKVRLLE
jgi:hypothetical protein